MTTRRQALRPTLVIADDVALRSAMRGALEDAGLHPVECADLTAARDAIERVRPLVVVLDLARGDEFGAQLLEELAARKPPPATVVCSPADAAVPRHAVARVTKPFELATLVSEVEQAARAALRGQSRKEQAG